jgi:hypothetical protein
MLELAAIANNAVMATILQKVCDVKISDLSCQRRQLTYTYNKRWLYSRYQGYRIGVKLEVG